MTDGNDFTVRIAPPERRWQQPALHAQYTRRNLDRRFIRLRGNTTLRETIDRLSIFATSHWAIEGFSASLSMFCWSPTPRFEEYNSWGHITSTYSSLMLYILLALAVAVFLLIIRDPWYSGAALAKSFKANVKKTLVFLSIVLCLGSWTIFLRQQSQAYYDIVFFDANYGGWRRPSIDKVASANLVQSAIGQASQSRCPIVDDAPPPAIEPTVRPTPSPTSIDIEPTSSDVSTPVPETTIEPATSPATVEATSADLTSGVPAVLPRSELLLPTEIRYQPDGDVFVNAVDAGQLFTLLGRNDAGNWYRVHWEDHIGWIPASSIDIPPSKTNEVAVPPLCARPKRVLSHFNDAWTSDVDGRIVAVIDIFRDIAGTEFSRSTFQVKHNGVSVREKEQAIPSSRSQYLFIGVSFDLVVKQGDRVEFSLAVTGQEMPHFQATIFRVPDGCSF